MSVRVYLPTTLAMLAEQHAAGAVAVPENPDDIVVAEDDDEESEYAALMTAADVSAAMLDGGGRRVVVVAEVPAPPAPGTSIPLREVVAVHADTEDRPAGADPDADLGWFATQEVPDLLGP